MKKLNYKKVVVVIVILMLIILGLIKFIIDKSYYFQDDNKKYEYNYFVEYSNQGKAGVIDKSGNEVIHTIYSDIYIPNPEKDVFVCMLDDDNYELINSKGEKLFTNYQKVRVFFTSDGNSDFEKENLCFEENGKYGLINFEGEIVAKPEYDSIESLKSKPGKFLVKKDEKFGVVNSDGKLIIPIEYISITGDNFTDEEDGYTKTGFIVKKQTTEGMVFGYINCYGKTLLKAEYESISRISNYNDKDNVYLVEMKDGKKGVFKNSKQIIKNEYQEITFSSNSNIIVAKSSKSSTFYNLNGKKILNKKYEEYSLAGNYISVLEDGAQKLYDANGNFVTNISYKNIQATSNPNYFITVDANNRYSIMNKSAEIKDNYKNLKYAYGDYFIFTNDDNKFGVLNVWSGVVVPAEYDSILKIYNIDSLEAKRGNETDIYTKDMKKAYTFADLIVENINDKYALLYTDTEKIYLDENGNNISNLNIFHNELYSVSKDGRWGFQDKHGNIIVECKYDMVTELNEYGFAGIRQDGKWGVIDKTGNIILEPEYEIDTYYYPSFIGKTYIEVIDTIHCIKLVD